jgi:hypothetical protein
VYIASNDVVFLFARSLCLKCDNRRKSKEKSKNHDYNIVVKYTKKNYKYTQKRHPIYKVYKLLVRSVGVTVSFRRNDITKIAR